MPSQKVTFKTLYWKCEDEDTEDGCKVFIYVSGVTENGKTVIAQIRDFEPWIYVELPSFDSGMNKKIPIKWSEGLIDTLFQSFQKISGYHKPTRYEFELKQSLYSKKECKLMKLYFTSVKATRFFADKCGKQDIYLDKLYHFNKGLFKVHEHNIDAIFKFASARDIKMADWVSIREMIIPEEEKLSEKQRRECFTKSDIGFRVHWEDVNPEKMPDTTQIKVKYFSFDIECYSVNHASKLPNPELEANCVFQISCVVGYLGEKEQRKFLISLYDPLDIDDVTIIRCDDEIELFQCFIELANDEKPDVFIGYNIIKFDWNYIILRAGKKEVKEDIIALSKLIGRSANIKKNSWSSAAYGEQEMQYLDPCGIINMDVLIEVERNFRLDSYSLNNVSEHFLGKKKDDITARQLFMLYKFTDAFLKQVKDLPSSLSKKDLISCRAKIRKLLPRRFCNGGVGDLRKALLACTTKKDMVYHTRRALTITGKYNVVDSILPIELIEKLNMLTTMEAMSNIMSVPMSYLHTRGQQIKIIAQIYKEAYRENIFIEYVPRISDNQKVDYMGATVFEAKPGCYKNVLTFDFTSLYPSRIIDENICYTTYIKDIKNASDKDSKLLSWKECVNCKKCEDTLRIDNNKSFCRHFNYRFNKPVTHPDGSRTGEGLLPRLERKLMGERTEVKKEMEKNKAMVKVATGKATPEDLAFYDKMGWETEKMKKMTSNEIKTSSTKVLVLDARQLALKISANSLYGILGFQQGMTPFVPGAASVTATGRILIQKVTKHIISKVKGHKWELDGKEVEVTGELVYGDTDSSMIAFPELTIPQAFELGGKLSKEATHFCRCDALGIPEEYYITHPKDGKKYRIDKYPRKDIPLLEEKTRILVYDYDYLSVNLNFENLYAEFIQLTKKRYIAFVVNKKGEVTQVVKKGVVLVRRNNCQFLRETYKKISDAILNRKSLQECQQILYDQTNKLFTRQVPDSSLIIYTSIKNLLSYAKKNDAGEYLDSEDKPISKLRTLLDGSVDPLDPRLNYQNRPNVIFTLKLTKRGDKPPPNSRLEYVFVETEHNGWSVKGNRKKAIASQGEKYEDYTYFKEHNDKLKIDRAYYIEKQFEKPITEILAVRFWTAILSPEENYKILHPIEKNEDVIERHFLHLKGNKMIDSVKNTNFYSKAIESTLNGQDTVIKENYSLVGIKTKVFVETPVSPKKEDILIGWDAIQHQMNKTLRKGFGKKKGSIIENGFEEMCCKSIFEPINHCPAERIYKPSTSQEAIIERGIAECRRQLLYKSFDAEYKELFDALLVRKSRKIINKIARATVWKNPHGAFDKLRIKTKKKIGTVMLLVNLKKYKKGSIGILKGMEEVPSTSVKKKKEYVFSMQMADEKIIKVARKNIAPFRFKGSTIIKEIRQTRECFSMMIKELNSYFETTDLIIVE